MKKLKNIKIGIIGMGYVGLPLAIEFSKFFNVVGFDIDNDRVSKLLLGNDVTGEVDADKLTGKLISIPEREQVPVEVTEQLVVEFYSR